MKITQETECKPTKITPKYNCTINNIEQTLIKMERDQDYYKKGKREYEMTTGERNDFEWEKEGEIIRVGNINKAKKGIK